MTRFTLNPAFFPEMEKALMRGLDDVGEEIRDEAKGNIASFSSSASRAIRKDPARGGSKPSVKVRMGKGLGPIFEFSKEQNRQLKGKGKFPAGTNRGVMQRREFFHRAVDKVVSKGLDLRRYL